MKEIITQIPDVTDVIAATEKGIENQYNAFIDGIVDLITSTANYGRYNCEVIVPAMISNSEVKSICELFNRRGYKVKRYNFIWYNILYICWK